MRLAPNAPERSCGTASATTGVPARVVARRHAHRVLGVAHGRLPRHPGRRASRPGKVDEVTHDRAIDMAAGVVAPTARLLYFDSDRTGISNIYAFDLDDARSWQVTNVLGGAFQAAPSPDGKRLAFDARGPDGRLRPLRAADRSRDAGCRRATTSTTSRRRSTSRDDAAAVTRAAPVPRARDARAAGVDGRSSTRRRTERLDPDRRHRRSRPARLLARASGSTIEHGDVNVGASYCYSGLRPGVRVSRRAHARRRAVAGASTASTRRSPRRTGAATLSSSIPFESRPTSSWTAVVRLRPRLVPPRQAADRRLDARSERSRAGPSRRPTTCRPASAARVGVLDGPQLDLRPRPARPASTARSRSATTTRRSARPTATSRCRYAADRFFKLWGKTPVLAMRAQARCAPAISSAPAASASAASPRRTSRCRSSTRRASAPIGYLRGYPARTVVGNQYHLLNLEYRQELLADRARPRDAARSTSAACTSPSSTTAAPRTTPRSIPTPTCASRSARRCASTRSSATSCPERSRSATRTA